MANWAEIRTIHTQFKTFYRIGGAFSIIALLALLGTIFFAHDLLGYAANVYTEAVSAVASVIVTVLILDKRAEQREERRRVEEMQAQLVRHAQINIRQVAVPAISEIRGHGWLSGDSGILRNKRLDGAELAGADLESANLQQTRFLHANLEGANLVNADLAHANLVASNLREADLSSAYLGHADLRQTDLAGAILAAAYLENAECCEANLLNADLSFADLRGASLLNANLAKACLGSVNFDEATTLPDGKHWQSPNDEKRFCDPSHPNFWRPGPDRAGNYPCWYSPDSVQ